jgi:hypothetical protein
MLTELYIETLLADEDLADRVWELWNAGLITDELAKTARWTIVVLAMSSDGSTHAQSNGM